MIPNTIHYCWFGDKEISRLALKCIDSWKKNFPYWKLQLWSEANSPMDNAYMQCAYENRKWSNMTNFIRLYALKKYGGIYFDTDVEVIKPFDFLNTYSCFVGFENSKTGNALSINNAVMGSVAGHPFVELSCDRLLADFDGLEESYLSGPGVTTTLLKEKGLNENREQDVEDVHVFAREKFHPFDWNDVFAYDCVKPDTYTIHHWNLSWKDAKAELLALYSEKQKLLSDLENARNYISDLKNGRIKTKELLKTNFYFFKNLFSN